jgi:hypothetical protein
LSGLPGTAPANDPRNTASYRAARNLAIGLGVLMVLAFLVVVVTLVTRVLGHGSAASGSPGSPSIDQLPAGSRITDMKVDSGHVVLRIHTDQGEEVRIIDDASGRVVSRIVAPAK